MRIPLLLPVTISSFVIPAAFSVDFEKEVLPIFETKCIECHKAPFEENGRTKKPKAGLRMDAAWAILAGGENGEILKPGDADGSEIFYRVTLPEDDDDFMPPTGKADPLTETEVALLKTWIDEGADFGKWKGNLEGKPADTASEEKTPVSEIQEIYTQISSGLGEIEEKQWASVSESGARVARLASKSPMLSVDFRLEPEKATPEAIATISTIAPHVVDLDLSKSLVTAESLSLLSEMPNLVRLNLSQTSLGDDAMTHIGGLKELRYLNLYGTSVTDAGLEPLTDLPHLDAIYLWQTKVTPKGVEKLQKALPDAHINLK